MMNRTFKTSYIFLLSIFVLSVQFLWAADFSMFYIEPQNDVNSVYKRKSNQFQITSENIDFKLPATPFQKNLKYSKKKKYVEAVVLVGENANRQKVTRKQLSQHLSDSRLVTLNSPKVKLTAAQFKKSKNKVKDVERFVYHYILDKKIGIPLISAESILKMRAGDCTEHAVLSVSILRALKIPARAVMGVVLSEEFFGNKNVFVYHMWCEAYYKGRWHHVDATRPDDKNPSKYIALSYHSLQTIMTLEYAEASANVKNMKIKYLK